MIRALLLMCAVLVAIPLSAYAQDIPQAQTPPAGAPSDAPPLLLLTRGKPTHPERIVLAWHKMVQQMPDFSVWAQKSPHLQGANPADRDIIVNNETNRLQQEWNDFDTSRIINVQTMIRLNNYSTLQEQLLLNEFTAKTFFSYTMYGENIAIVPKEIAQFSKIKMPKAQMDELIKKAGGGQIMAEFLLRATEADGKSPFKQGGTSYWLILAKIEEIRFWSLTENKQELLWMYRAGDYKPKEDKSLLDLKAGGR